jgi:hypothetical protein
MQKKTVFSWFYKNQFPCFKNEFQWLSKSVDLESVRSFLLRIKVCSILFIFGGNGYFVNENLAIGQRTYMAIIEELKYCKYIHREIAYSGEPLYIKGKSVCG